jgi:hypothetical protein
VSLRLQLMTVLEANHDPELIPEVIRLLETHTLSDVASRPMIQEPFRPLLARHQYNRDVVATRRPSSAAVVFFDVADEGLDAMNKFIAYDLYPEARYVVWVGCSRKKAKVSIGSNPWRPEQRRHDLSAIAERWGGGGHPGGRGDELQARGAAPGPRGGPRHREELRSDPVPVSA